MKNKHFTLSEDGALALDVTGVTGSGTAGAVVSGDPGVAGQIPFVAHTDADADSIATCYTRGVFDLAVTGGDDMGGAAIAYGDILYWDEAAAQINVNAATGVRFGYALDAVDSGATTTIPVLVGY